MPELVSALCGAISGVTIYLVTGYGFTEWQTWALLVPISIGAVFYGAFQYHRGVRDAEGRY